MYAESQCCPIESHYRSKLHLIVLYLYKYLIYKKMYNYFSFRRG